MPEWKNDARRRYLIGKPVEHARRITANIEGRVERLARFCHRSAFLHLGKLAREYPLSIASNLSAVFFALSGSGERGSIGRARAV